MSFPESFYSEFGKFNYNDKCFRFIVWLVAYERLSCLDFRKKEQVFLQTFTALLNFLNLNYKLYFSAFYLELTDKFGSYLEYVIHVGIIIITMATHMVINVHVGVCIKVT